MTSKKKLIRTFISFLFAEIAYDVSPDTMNDNFQKTV